MMRFRPFRRRTGAEGFIVVAVLWILAALAALVSIYAVYVTNAAVASRIGDDRLRVEAAIWAGAELTAYQLLGAEPANRPTSGRFKFQLGRAEVSVEFLSEGARIDLNAAKKEILSGLFSALGAPPSKSAYYAERVIGWRKKSQSGEQFDETTIYRSAGLSYGPRQAPFQDSAELRLVAGLPPDIVEKALPLVTVFNGRAEIDANVAEATVLSSLPHISPDIVAEILKVRVPTDPRVIQSLLGEARASVAMESRKATRAQIHAVLDQGRRVNAELVLLILEDGPEPYRILSWRDDFDG
ncbi:general secretion pathway protein GspK [Methylocapsa palsarum]|uniref:General secretion pathway protein K n=1 Tax=Methylocapsa palsarum TaxID=1612308 RepID=A0A1I3WUZ5_9HYPH|nr:type II secretion system protein GspK [Methylocapsa palsarum]SFK11335.1 general secretion pathway protein K [Methylocapsa palsarum]